MMITGKDNVDVARMLTLKSALTLQIKGIGLKGPSAASRIKREFGLKGNNKNLLEKFSKLIEDKQGIEGYNSVAKWKEGEVELEGGALISFEEHDTEQEAQEASDKLRDEGIEGSVFPEKTWVEPRKKTA